MILTYQRSPKGHAYGMVSLMVHAAAGLLGAGGALAMHAVYGEHDVFYKAMAVMGVCAGVYIAWLKYFKVSKTILRFFGLPDFVPRPSDS